MNKRLKAELWEIQMILYLILAQMVHTDWIAWGLRIWAGITFLGALNLIAQAKNEKQKKERGKGGEKK